MSHCVTLQWREEAKDRSVSCACVCVCLCVCVCVCVCDNVQMSHDVCECDIVQMSHSVTLQRREEAQDRSVSCVCVTLYKCRTV